MMRTLDDDTREPFARLIEKGDRLLITLEQLAQHLQGPLGDM